MGIFLNPNTDVNLITSDVTTHDSSTGKHGFLPKLSGSVNEVMTGAGTWQPVTTLASLTFMFSGTASDIATYYSMPALSAYVAGAAASLPIPVSTTPTLLVAVATNTGYPNTTKMPAGEYTCHYETTKGAGSNNYYTYFELYKRTSGGVETLLGTSDNTTVTAVNTAVQQTTTLYLTSDATLLATDRLVIKMYAVMLSSTATITTRFDDATNARLTTPSSGVDATNFVPYTGSTQSVDIGDNTLSCNKIDINGSNTTSGILLNVTATSNANVSSQWGSNLSPILTGGAANTEQYLTLLNGSASAGASTATMAGLLLSQTLVGGASVTAAYGLNNSITINPTVTLANTFGGYNSVYLVSGQNCTNVYVNANQLALSATALGGTINTAVGSRVSFSPNAAATKNITTFSSFKAENIANGAAQTVTNAYGFHSLMNSGTGRFSFYGSGTAPSYFGGDVQYTKTITAGGTTGAQTINKTTGTVNFAAAAASLVVTNSLVTTSSIVQCTIGTNDATMTSVKAVAAAGSFTIYPNANPTAETRVNFTVTN
jgi:hypothetical protein